MLFDYYVHSEKKVGISNTKNIDYELFTNLRINWWPAPATYIYENIWILPSKVCSLKVYFSEKKSNY